MDKNIDIFSIPLFYISFEPKPKLEKHYAKHGFKNVSHFPAVDGRKMNPETLRKNNVISIRAYNDLRGGRREHSGLSTMGAVGCTMSHCELWKMCIKRNWPYIIIVEEDNKMNGSISKNDQKSIVKILNKPSSVFLSTKITNEDHGVHFYGLHFYIPSLNACKAMVKYCYPIDVQTDWYVSHVANMGKIHIEGFSVAGQDKYKSSGVQDGCIICHLPKNRWFYLGIIIVMLVVIFILLFFRQKYQECKESCSMSSSSQSE